MLLAFASTWINPLLMFHGCFEYWVCCTEAFFTQGQGSNSHILGGDYCSLECILINRSNSGAAFHFFYLGLSYCFSFSILSGPWRLITEVSDVDNHGNRLALWCCGSEGQRHWSAWNSVRWSICTHTSDGVRGRICLSRRFPHLLVQHR